MSFLRITLFTALTFFKFNGFAQEVIKYQKPSQTIIDLVDAPILPKAIFSSNGEWMLLLQPQGLISANEALKPEIKIAGLFIDPSINSVSVDTFYTDIKLKSVNKEEEYILTGLPESLLASEIRWSPDDSKIAFCNTTNSGIELWIADLRTFTAKRLTDQYLNKTVGNTYCWEPESKSLIAKFITADRGKVPPITAKISGPITFDNSAKLTSSTNNDNLNSAQYGKSEFSYYLISQLITVDMDGKTSNFYNSGIIKSFDFSPDGKYILIETIKKYIPGVPINQLPYSAEILSSKGSVVKKIFDAPLADNLVNNYDAVPKGPRQIGWRTDKPASLYWIEAQDFGDPNLLVSLRDAIYTLDAPFKVNKIKIADCYLRFKSIIWNNDNLAIVTERWWKTRAERRVYIKPADPTFRINLVDRYFDDTYSDPGQLVITKNEYNRPSLLTEDANVFYIGYGGSVEGERPYLMKFNIETKITDTLFHSKAPYYERPLFFNNKHFVITSREAIDSVPNYYRVKLPTLGSKQLTDFSDPYPNLIGIKNQRLSYQRPDGVPINGILYLPASYTRAKGTLPLIVWACPKEYKTKTAAGTVKGSVYQFPKLDQNSPLYWLTKGYAVFDKMEMPIIGESQDEPYDTYLEQLRFNTEPAIKKLIENGIADPKRIAITGNDNGGDMAAVLLATTKLFTTGIAYNGIYNYTYSPFGFNSEQRTFWQVPELYSKLSALSLADKIKAPILLLSAINDLNETMSLQAYSFYTALKGNSVSTRLSVVPTNSKYELSRESILHILWEKERWLEKNLKGK
ncbi:MAG: aminoacyl peptidase [Sphingobacteriales bacterium]|nr:aminoacyl peptidase [Sphingobacteriales bacterium]